MLFELFADSTVKLPSFHSKSDNILKLDAAFGYYTALDDTLPFEEAFHRADQNM